MGQLDSIKDYMEPGSEEYTLMHYSYDNNGRTIAMRTQDDDGVILETFSYEYDKNSQIIEETHVNNLPEEAKRINETTGYTYDNFGRLTQSAKTDHQNSNAQSVITYDYDGVGNRISMTENGVETTYTYNSLNQLMSSAENGEGTTYTYDGRGNQIVETKGDVTTESTYSVRGEMVSLTTKNGDTVVSSQENQYNHDGIRISKKEDGTNRHYYYDNGVIAYTKDGTTLSSANVTGPDGQVVGTFRGDDYHIYLKDIQGSTTNIMKQDGSLSVAYEYSDFGETEEITGSSFDNEICYTGAIYDDTTGLYYMNARYYDPVNGRFISQDMYRGELNNPAQWHLYAYCTNNPINYVDPSGHAAVCLGWGVQFDVALGRGNFGMTFLYLNKNVKTRYEKKAVHIYNYVGASVDGEDAVDSLYAVLKNPSSLLSAKNLKGVLGKGVAGSVIFFCMYGPKTKFKSYEKFEGMSSSFGITLWHVTVTVSVSSLSMSPGFGFSTNKFSFSFGQTYSKFHEGLTNRARKIGNATLNKFEKKSKK